MADEPRFPRTRRPGTRWPGLLLVAFLAVSGQPAGADILVGPWRFDDRAFADRALQLGAGEPIFYCNATDLHTALTGFSPDTQVVNCGAGTFANDFLMEFLDLPAINLPGPDIVFFEARYSVDTFEIAVRPAGGEITPFLPYRDDEFIDSGLVPDCHLNPAIVGLEIELDDYGLPPGTMVDAIRVNSIPISPDLDYTEGDPTMAGVLVPGCIDATPPPEPSAPFSGRPLRVRERPDARLTVERVDEATAYNVYADSIGSWYNATRVGGTVCTVTSWTDNGDGTLTLDYRVPPDSWIVVSAAHGCGESGVGTDSAGTRRFSVGLWERCPVGP